MMIMTSMMRMMAVVLLLPLLVPRAKSDHETPKTSFES